MIHWITKNNLGMVTSTDRMLEMASLVLGIFLVALAFVLHRHLPDLVPVHFNALGEADRWGDKDAIFELLAFGMAIMAICSVAAYNYKMVNLPFFLNPACLAQQATIIGRMMRILSVLCGLLFVVLMLMTAIPQWGMRSVLVFLLWAIVAGITVVLIVYTVWIYRKGRRCQ